MDMDAVKRSANRHSSEITAVLGALSAATIGTVLLLTTGLRVQRSIAWALAGASIVAITARKLSYYLLLKRGKELPQRETKKEELQSRQAVRDFTYQSPFVADLYEPSAVETDGGTGSWLEWSSWVSSGKDPERRHSSKSVEEIIREAEAALHPPSWRQTVSSWLWQPAESSESVADLKDPLEDSGPPEPPLTDNERAALEELAKEKEQLANWEELPVKAQRAFAQLFEAKRGVYDAQRQAKVNYHKILLEKYVAKAEGKLEEALVYAFEKSDSKGVALMAQVATKTLRDANFLLKVEKGSDGGSDLASASQ